MDFPSVAFREHICVHAALFQTAAKKSFLGEDNHNQMSSRAHPQPQRYTKHEDTFKYSLVGFFCRLFVKITRMNTGTCSVRWAGEKHDSVALRWYLTSMRFSCRCFGYCKAVSSWLPLRLNSTAALPQNHRPLTWSLQPGGEWPARGGGGRTEGQLRSAPLIHPHLFLRAVARLSGRIRSGQKR